MNKFFVIAISSILLGNDANSMRAPKDGKEADSWYHDMAVSIKAVSATENDAHAIDKLGSYLRKLGRNSSHPDPRWRQCYQSAQKGLLRIPGHARYFADQTESVRKAQEHLPRANQTNYDFWRKIYLKDTLMHLPSPETIEVLGRYLDDERDAPFEITALPENSYLAFKAILGIGLRNPPSRHFGFNNWREELEKTRVWYSQVKAGTLPFSFEGQNVEYRFKPDGTVESTPIKVSVERPLRRPPPLVAETALIDRSQWNAPGLWAWIACGALALFIPAWIWYRKNRSRKKCD